MVYFPTRKFVKVYNSPRTRELTDWCKSYATVTTTIGIQQVEEETNVFTAVREATRKDTVQSTPSHRQTRCTLLTIGTVVYILSFLEGILFHCYTQKKTCLKYVCKEQKKKKKWLREKFKPCLFSHHESRKVCWREDRKAPCLEYTDPFNRVDHHCNVLKSNSLSTHCTQWLAGWQRWKRGQGLKFSVFSLLHNISATFSTTTCNTMNASWELLSENVYCYPRI